MENLLLVDNAAYSYGFQLDNGIPIIPYYDNKKDTELKSLCALLRSVHDRRDPWVRELFQTRRFLEWDNATELVSRLFR